MLKIQWDMPIFLALLIWLCTSPIVALLVVFWGWGVGLTAAAVLLVAILLVCWLLCVGALWQAGNLKDK